MYECEDQDEGWFLESVLGAIHFGTGTHYPQRTFAWLATVGFAAFDAALAPGSWQPGISVQGRPTISDGFAALRRRQNQTYHFQL